MWARVCPPETCSLSQATSVGLSHNSRSGDKTFKDVWGQRTAQAATAKESYERESAKIAKQVEALLDRVVDAESDAVAKAYERRIAQLERTRLLLAEKAATVNQRKGTFEELFEHAMCFLSSPSKIWSLGTMEYKKLVLRLTFAEHLSYCPDQGFEPQKRHCHSMCWQGLLAGK